MAGYESVSSAAVAMQAGPGCVGRDRAPASARLCCPSGLERAACGEGRVASTRSITAPPAASWMPPSSSSWPRPSYPDLFQDLSIPWPPIRRSTSTTCPSVPGTFMLGIKQDDVSNPRPIRVRPTSATPLLATLLDCGRLLRRPFQD